MLNWLATEPETGVVAIRWNTGCRTDSGTGENRPPRVSPYFLQQRVNRFAHGAYTCVWLGGFHEHCRGSQCIFF